MRPKKNLPILPSNEDTPATSNRDSREDAFIHALMLTDSIPKAGQIAGYSETYSKGLIYQKFKSKPFQDKLIEHFRAHCFTDLPTIRKISKLGLERIERDLESGNGELASKLKHIPQMALQVTKILAPEPGPGVPVVNIEDMKVQIINNLSNGKGLDDKDS